MNEDAVPGERATYRGVRWHRDPQGNLAWRNDELGGWVRWRPGGEAPPVPPRWEADAAASPVPPRLQRPGWRSPYRLVPLVVVAAVVVFGTLQAIQTANTAPSLGSRRAQALLGRCLARTGTAAGRPTYASSPESCTAPGPRGRVVALVVAGSKGGCPPATTALQLTYQGVATPEVECVAPQP